VVDVALHAVVRHQRRRAEQARGHVAADADFLLLTDFGGRRDHVLCGVHQLVDVEVAQVELRVRACRREGKAGKERDACHRSAHG
jgi:hypothetical protein